MHQAIANHARGRLGGEAAPMHMAECFVTLAEKDKLALLGPEQATWLDRPELEHENLRAVLRWAIQAGAAEHGLWLGAALRPF